MREWSSCLGDEGLLTGEIPSESNWDFRDIREDDVCKWIVDSKSPSYCILSNAFRSADSSHVYRAKLKNALLWIDMTAR